MSSSLPIYLRSHTVSSTTAEPKPLALLKQKQLKWPTFVLVVDCETRIDVSQALTFGCARFCRLETNGRYQCVQEILFYADDTPRRDAEGFESLCEYARQHASDALAGDDILQVVSRSEFIEKYFWRTLLDAKGMIVCFNAPFDISRLAIDVREARRKNEGWSFVMSHDIDPLTGLQRDCPFQPWVKITPKDGKSAFIRLTGVGIKSKKSGERLKSFCAGRFLDLKTLGWALRNESFSLNSACQHFGVEGKFDHEPTGKISVEEIEYCRQDVRATTGLLNAMRADFDLHPIGLNPDQAYSPASIAKAYLRTMRIIPPGEKFRVPDWVQGIAMQSYYGGRSECRIRHTEIPCVLTDLMSEYTTANVNMGLWKFLTAERLRIEEATVVIQNLVNSFKPEMALDKGFWPQLCFFALVRPSGDIFPVRTTYNGKSTNIGINPLTSKEPIWYAGPDIFASMLLTGKAPEIVRAIRVIPEGRQQRMKSVRLRGQIHIDPRKQDFFKSVIEARAAVKQDKSLNKGERDALAYFLKILASSGSYGLFVEVNPTKVCKGEREHLTVFSGDVEFPTTSEILEMPGRWYFPIFGSLITSAGRLMLALIEFSVTKRGGTYLFCDTDSMAIVASEQGGLFPCLGGPFRLSDGREAAKALPWQEVKEIQKELDNLNPYDRTFVLEPILKIEEVNYANGMQRQIFGHATAAKRYVIYSRTEKRIEIVSAKAHGLGFLHAPKRGFNKDIGAPDWVIEGWNWILGQLEGDAHHESPSWFGLPAMMRCTVTTREVLKALQASQRKVPYPDRAGKPFNFMMTPLLDELDGYPIEIESEKFTLVAPFESDSSRWFELLYVNTHDPNIGRGRGTKYRLGKPNRRLPSEALPQTYGDFVSRYAWHREAKSNGPDGRACDAHTEGLLSRVAIVTTSFEYVGKETDRRWEQGEDISLLEGEVVRYRPNETEKLATDTELQHKLRQYSIRSVARAAHVSENTVKRARRGERLQKAVAKTLHAAVSGL